ncbi:hypothetical protein BC829DRAFT_378656 [Chytridium lagenaria]|nr:hypothetical protein BC829DRAFT_378656 [Chytridium lagenaria]
MQLVELRTRCRWYHRTLARETRKQGESRDEDGKVLAKWWRERNGMWRTVGMP